MQLSKAPDEKMNLLPDTAECFWIDVIFLLLMEDYNQKL